MLLVYLDNKTRNWAMDTKHEDQMKPVIEQWHFSNSLVSLLGFLAPAAFLAILLGHSGTFIEFLLNADYWKIKGLRSTKTQKQPQDIYFSNWLLNFFSHLKFRNDSKSGFSTVSPRDIWQDGSILCNLVNMVVPGACKDPRAHRLQTPKHGQKLVYEYFDIKPIFTPLDLSQKSLSPTQEKKFSKYLNEIHQILRKDNDNITNMKFSTDFVARGMGLVVAQQNKKSTFYIYPIAKRYPNTCDLDILIKGPCGNNGKITIPALSQPTQKCQPSTEYKRSLYMSSKLNSISPTLQGSSFLRKLSLSNEDSQNEMDIKVKLSTTRVKVSYVPENTGIYEISLVTRGCHVVGSPFSVPVEFGPFSNCCANDTDSENEQENKLTYKKAKVLSRIVDFVDEKMLLQDDGTLVKIDENDKNTDISKKYCFNKNHLKAKKFVTSIAPFALNNKNKKIETNKKLKHNIIADKEKINDSNNSIDLEENNNFVETKHQSNTLEKNVIGEETSDLENLSNFHYPKEQEFPDNLTSVSASFTEVNAPQILNSKDPTLTTKVQDSQFNLEEIPLKNVENENRVAINENISNIPNGLTIGEIGKSKQTCPNTLRKSLKKMGAIADNQSIDRRNSIVEKQKQYWTEKMNTLNNKSELARHSKPAKILKSSFSNSSSESIEEIHVDTDVLSFDGIVENNVKLFEVKLNPECSDQKKRSFKIDIPTLNLRETIIVKNIEIVTNKQNQNLIKLPSIEERKSKLLQACNKPLRPKRVRNIISNKIEDNEQEGPNVQLEKSTSECNVSVRRKYRFKRAKLFFQSLEKPSSNPEEKLSAEKHLGIISIKVENDSNKIKEMTKKQEQNLRKCNSDSEYLLSSSAKTKFARSESDPCVVQRIPKKLSERFQVTGFFKDVLEDSRFIGLPNKKAVVASLASLEATCDPLANNLNTRDINEIDYFEKRTKKSDKNQNSIPGYHKDFPHTPNKNSWKYRSRDNSEKTGLIPGRKLLKENVEINLIRN